MDNQQNSEEKHRIDGSFKAHNLEPDLLSLKVNLGYQRTMYQGLLYAKGFNVEKLIVMDSDGEDDPHAILDLLPQEADYPCCQRKA